MIIITIMVYYCYYYDYDIPIMLVFLLLITRYSTKNTRMKMYINNDDIRMIKHCLKYPFLE